MNENLRREVVFVWTVVYGAFYAFTIMPAIALIAYYSRHEIHWGSVTFIWIAGSALIAIFAFLVFSLGAMTTETTHERLQERVVTGRRLMLYTNPVGLVYALWTRIIVPLMQILWAQVLVPGYYWFRLLLTFDRRDEGL